MISSHVPSFLEGYQKSAKSHAGFKPEPWRRLIARTNALSAENELEHRRILEEARRLHGEQQWPKDFSQFLGHDLVGFELIICASVRLTTPAGSTKASACYRGSEEVIFCAEHLVKRLLRDLPPEPDQKQHHEAYLIHKTDGYGFRIQSDSVEMAAATPRRILLLEEYEQLIANDPQPFYWRPPAYLEKR